MGGRLLVVACIAGCGRVGFDVSTDASGDDADATPLTCDPPRRLCEDFEAATLDPRWMSIGSVVLDTMRVHSGTRSMHVHTDAIGAGQGAYAGIWERETLVLNDSTFHFRAWIWVDALPLNNLGLVDAVETTAENEVGLFLEADNISLYTQFEERSRPTMTPPAIQTWLCLQWTVVRSTTGTGSMVLAGDGGAAMMTNIQTDNATGLSELDVGISLSPTTTTIAQPAMDIWIDDIMLSAAPIACTD